MSEFELGAASLSWHCTVSGSKVNLASKSFGHGPDCCIWAIISSPSPTARNLGQADRHTTIMMNRCEPDSAKAQSTNPMLGEPNYPLD